MRAKPRKQPAPVAAIDLLRQALVDALEVSKALRMLLAPDGTPPTPEQFGDPAVRAEAKTLAKTFAALCARVVVLAVPEVLDDNEPLVAAVEALRQLSWSIHALGLSGPDPNPAAQESTR